MAQDWQKAREVEGWYVILYSGEYIGLVRTLGGKQIMGNRLGNHGIETRKEIYDFLVKYAMENGFAPSVREIGEAVGIKSTSTVCSNLWKLENEGKIEMKGNSPRAIRLVGFEIRKVDD